MNGIKFLKFIFPALFLPTFCFAETTLNFSVNFVNNGYVGFLILKKPTFIHSLKVFSCTGGEQMSIFCNNGEKLLYSFDCNNFSEDEIILDDTYNEECDVFETTTTSTLPEFLQNQFLPTLGQILTDLVPLFIMIIGISIAFIFLKGFIEFFKPFFKGK